MTIQKHKEKKKVTMNKTNKEPTTGDVVASRTLKGLCSSAMPLSKSDLLPTIIKHGEGKDS